MLTRATIVLAGRMHLDARCDKKTGTNIVVWSRAESMRHSVASEQKNSEWRVERSGERASQSGVAPARRVHWNWNKREPQGISRAVDRALSDEATSEFTNMNSM